MIFVGGVLTGFVFGFLASFGICWGACQLAIAIKEEEQRDERARKKSYGGQA